MKITHADGVIVDTDKLCDVDALLLEESAKLHKLFAKYNRQLLLLGEMKGSDEFNMNKSGTSFFHIMDPNVTVTPEVRDEKYNKYISRIHGFVQTISQGYLGIVRFSSTDQ